MEATLTTEIDGVRTHQKYPSEKVRYGVIREDMVAITGSISQAVCLYQMIKWFKSKNRAIAILAEDVERFGDEISLSKYKYVWKTAKQLSTETCLSEKQCKDALRELTDKNYLIRQSNPSAKWDKTYQYLVNIKLVAKNLLDSGFATSAVELLLDEGFKVSPIRQIVPSGGQNVRAIPSSTTSSTNINNSVDSEKNKGLISGDPCPEKTQGSPLKKETVAYRKSREYVLSDEFANSICGHELYGKYKITPETIAWKVDAISNWSKVDTVKDWAATCRNWLRRDIERGAIRRKDEGLLDIQF